MSRETSRARASVRQICRAFGISRAAYYAAKSPRRRLRRRREVLGEAPRGWASAEELEAPIGELARAHPAWGVRKIWASLRRRGLRVSRKRVWALMRQSGLVLPAPSAHEAVSLRGHVTVPESNRRWATDLTTVWTRRDGWVAVVPTVDCGDRFCLNVEVTKSQESEAVLSGLERALREQFGDPSGVSLGLELRTDHGPQFTGFACEQLCESWGLEHSWAPVGRPTGNAVAERLILTLKMELIWTRDWETIEQLREAVQEWVSLYNHERPHQSLDWRTPAEQRELNLRGRADAAA